MIAKYIVLSNRVSAAADNILRICILKLLLTLKKIQFMMFILQHITAYSFAIKFTCLTPGNVCVQAEGMVKPKKIFSTDPAPCQKNFIKK